MKVKIKPLYKDTIIPTKADEDSAGYDLYAVVDNSKDKNKIIIYPHETAIIDIGWAM